MTNFTEKLLIKKKIMIFVTLLKKRNFEIILILLFIVFLMMYTSFFYEADIMVLIITCWIPGYDNTDDLYKILLSIDSTLLFLYLLWIVAYVFRSDIIRFILIIRIHSIYDYQKFDNLNAYSKNHVLDTIKEHQNHWLVGKLMRDIKEDIERNQSI